MSLQSLYLAVTVNIKLGYFVSCFTRVVSDILVFMWPELTFSQLIKTCVLFLNSFKIKMSIAFYFFFVFQVATIRNSSEFRKAVLANAIVNPGSYV